MRGRFLQKRSVERHHELVHRTVWKPVLPEPNRAAKHDTKGKDREAVGDDDEMEEQDRGVEMSEGHGEGATEEATGDVAGVEDAEQGELDVEMSDAVEALKEPTAEHGTMFQSIDEVVKRGKK